MVTARKCAMSDLSRHGRPPSCPITPLSATAATRMMSGKAPLRQVQHPHAQSILHSHLRLDVWMRVIARQCEVVIAKREDISDRRIELQLRQRPRRARELQACLLQVIEIKVCVAERMDELARLIASHLRYD